VLGGSLLLAAGAFAGNNNATKKTLHLYESATVEGTQLPPGDYKVEWSGTGPDVKVNILKHGDTVVSVPARIESQNTSNNQDGYSLIPAKDGKQSISEIFFSGEKFDLKLDQGSNANNNSQGSNSGSN
jgi:hypothetical protein